VLFGHPALSHKKKSKQRAGVPTPDDTVQPSVRLHAVHYIRQQQHADRNSAARTITVSTPGGRGGQAETTRAHERAESAQKNQKWCETGWP
jgi:hypothetical protein